MPTAKVTSKGQVTIPKEIRERLHLKTGDRLRFTVDERGEVRVAAENVSLLDLVGSVRPRVPGLTLEEVDRRMQLAAASRVVEGLKE